MPYNFHKHHRRSIRLKGYDYSQAGLHFVTICCEKKEHRFGSIMDGQMILNECGQIAYVEWTKLPERFPNFALDVFQIMPNHIHGIVSLIPVGAGFTPAQNVETINPYNSGFTPAQNDETINPHNLELTPAQNVETINPYNSGFTPAQNDETINPHNLELTSAQNNETINPYNSGFIPAQNDETVNPYNSGFTPAQNNETINPHNSGFTPAQNDETINPHNSRFTPAQNDETVNPHNSGFTPAQNDETTNPRGQTCGEGQPQGLPLQCDDGDVAAHLKTITVGDIIGAYKSIVANGCLNIFKTTNQTMGKLWQRNFYEHIIRDDRSYQTIANYIANNPSKWSSDKFYTT